MERNFHSAILYKQKLIIFGGKENGYLNDVHEFNIQTEKWSRIITNSNENQPTPRYGHTAVLWQDNMYVYGGYDNEGFCDNNMYTLDLVTNHWLPKHQLPTIPERFHHTSELFPDTGLLLIIGGCNHKKQALKSVFEINLNNYTVRECSPLPEARFGHCSYNTFGNIYIAGGCDYEYDNNTLLLREENEEWKIVEGKPFENGCVFGTVSITQNGPLVIGGIRRNKFRRLANIDEYYKQLCMNHAVPRNDKPFGIPKEIELPKSEFDLNVKIVFVGDRGVGCWTLEHAVLWGNFKIKAEYIPVCYGNNYFSVMYGGQPVGYTLWSMFVQKLTPCRFYCV
jgi:N-acetylneuraminic acid mutarotase